jgi:peptide/nickel transport system permease protein
MTTAPFTAGPGIVAAPATRRAGRRIGLRPQTIGMLAAVGLLLLTAVVGPMLMKYSPTVGNAADRLRPIGSPGHLLGTDGQGRDVLTRLLSGMRLSLGTGLAPVGVAAVVGTSIGLAAGLARPRVNTAIMRCLDVFYAFPTVLLAIAVGAALGPGIRNAIIALCVVLVPPVVRVVEGAVASIRGADFMEAAACSGASVVRIALRQVLPNVAAPMLVYGTSLIGLSIVEAAGLSFLGLGAAPPRAEWGLMLNDGRNYFFAAPAVALVPAAAILVSSILFNLVGDRLAVELQVNRKELS